MGDAAPCLACCEPGSCLPGRSPAALAWFPIGGASKICSLCCCCTLQIFWGVVFNYESMCTTGKNQVNFQSISSGPEAQYEMLQVWGWLAAVRMRLQLLCSVHAMQSGPKERLCAIVVSVAKLRILLRYAGHDSGVEQPDD